MCLIKAKIVFSRLCGRDTINNTCVDDIDDVGDENRNKKPTWAKRFHMILLLHFLFPVFALSGTSRMFLIIVIMIMVIITILLVIMIMLISGDHVDQGGVDHNNDSLS